MKSILVCLLAVMGGCLPRSEFHCATDGQCSGGTCVAATGACAVDDATCPSHQRYVGAFGGACVDPTGSDTVDGQPDGPDTPAFVRDVCLVGPAMPTGRDACVDAVCAKMPSCCTLGWTETCAQHAASSCSPTSGSGGRCPAEMTLLGENDLSTMRFRPDPVEPNAVVCTTKVPGTWWATSAAWADIDGDGDADLALAGLGYLRVYEGNGVSPSTFALDLGEPVLAPAVTAGTPENRPDTPFLWGSRVAVGDADHDGDLDVAWADEREGLRLFVREAGPPVRYDETVLIAHDEIQAPYPGVGVGWMQLDTDPELELVGSLNDQFLIFDRQANGTWTRKAGPTNIGGGFVTTLDRVVTKSGRVFLGGTLSLVSGPTLAIGGTRGVTLSDIDDDGHLDVIAGTPGGVLLARGGASGFGAVQSLSTTNNWNVGVGDIDGDGRLDLVGATHLRPQTVLLQQAGGTFAAAIGSVVGDAVDAQALTAPTLQTVDQGLCNWPCNGNHQCEANLGESNENCADCVTGTMAAP